MPIPGNEAPLGHVAYLDDVKGHPIIDTRAPLRLASGTSIYCIRSSSSFHLSRPKGSEQNFLFLDVLDVHLIRNRDCSTMISYHPDCEWRMTTARDLQSRVRLIGESVYWQNIFKASNDPTLLLVALLWHVVYAWDQALETLYAHISFLVSFVSAPVIESAYDRDRRGR
jgi:hypothetical protein